MFYKLKSSYALRGWEKMAWVLVKRPENRLRRLSKDMFQVLLLCDGQTDLGEILRDEPLKQALRQCESEGIVKRCESAEEMDKEQYYRYFHNRYVEMVLWSVTGRCNFRCRHCFMDGPGGILGELSTETALDLIDQMADCGVLRVDLTGGEPFVRNDFWQLVDRILSHGMHIGKIYTNGWLLNEHALEEFERRKIRPDISVSFDGAGWHDWMRGIPGAEQAALRALQLCKERGFRTDVEMCIHRGNQDSLPQTIEVLKQAGVLKLKVSGVAMTELWSSHSEGNALTQQEYIEAMIRYIPEYYKAGCPMELTLSNVAVLLPDGTCNIVAEFYDGTDSCLNCHMCNAARWNCYITPEGRLLPCMPMTSSPEQELFPKIQDIGLRQGLSDSLYMEFINRRVKDLFQANGECGSCPYRYRCGGGCRATALLDGNHDLMGCDRTMCLLWKGGYVERIRQTADQAMIEYGKGSSIDQTLRSRS